MPSQEIGKPIPNIEHAVSVTLPTWEATIGYEKGEDWVVSKMTLGYPRFFIHSVIKTVAKEIETKYGREGESAMVFPTYNVAKRCREFIKKRSDNKPSVRVLQLSTRPPANDDEKSTVLETNIGVVFFPTEEFPVAKQYWQHSGEGISSRMGEYLLKELFKKEASPGPLLFPNSSHNVLNKSSANNNLKQDLQAKQIQKKSPSISHSSPLTANEEIEKEFNTFIEQKYGRVLDLKFAKESKIALRRRICGKVDKSHNQIEEMEKASRGKHLSEVDVLLYPSGMAAIFNAHRALLNIWDTPKKSVCFGFPYLDTLNILNKFGPGCHFLGMGDDESLDQLEKDLESGTIDIMALFCECPSNPLLKTPNLKKIRELADKFNFAVVVDETVGNFLNINVLPYADMVASSLTKVFSGDSNVMAGSLVLNPLSKYYDILREYFDEDFEDLLWEQDALYLERNSRDFASRAAKIDDTTLETVKLLQNCDLIAQVYHPSISPTKHHYDSIRNADGGYGGLISFVFHEEAAAICFFNTVNIHKGPSLGTNFTLACPYAILAHYHELDEIAQWGVDRNLIRISIGLEEPRDLLAILQHSLNAASKIIK